MADSIGLEVNWDAVTGAGTVALAALAIWGDTIRRRIYKPTLVLSLRDFAGDRIDAVRIGDPERFGTRYLHAVISNTVRDFPFHNVTASLVRVLTRTPGGQWRTRWTGPVPLSWQHEANALQNQRERVVGPTRIVDLFSINQFGELTLNPIVRPHNLTTEYNKALHGPILNLAMDIQACSDEGDSKVMRVEIEWDWIWIEGANEILRHIEVSFAESPDQHTTPNPPSNALSTNS